MLTALTTPRKRFSIFIQSRIDWGGIDQVQVSFPAHGRRGHFGQPGSRGVIMRSDSLFLCLLIAVSLAGGCQQPEHQEGTVVSQPVSVVPSGTLTLSSDQLALLDWSGRSPSGPKVLRKDIVDDSGIVFEIRFAGVKPWQNSIDYVSSGSGGRMALVGLDVGAYEALALKFTLVSIDGASGATLPQELSVGAVIGPTEDGRLSYCEPILLGFARQQVSGVARTPIGVGRLREIGIHVRIANPDVWNPEGALVTLMVEPVSDAAALPSTPVADEKKPRPKASELPDFGPGRMGAW